MNPLLWTKHKIVCGLMIATVLLPLGALAYVKDLAEPAAIPADQFVKLHTLIKPQPGELRFHEIPWLIDLWKRAASGRAGRQHDARAASVHPSRKASTAQGIVVRF